eukprot:TRINITY_DN17659_c0_g1_i1.p1 TRINITY_DN17659_c0_g1~~TRINITY_DN17659_c0_g1_i1.p1  ORF type:complete len:506 (+),score=81.89 TRINITY_DN17659_c0_g1_i1:36-1520(+)
MASQRPSPSATSLPALGSSSAELIPGLQDDVALHCFALLPFTSRVLLASVCKSWRKAVRDGDLTAVRGHLGLLEPSLFILLESAKFGHLHLMSYNLLTKAWITLRPLPRRLTLVEGGDRSEAINGFGLVALAGSLYLIGGFDRLTDGTDRCLSGVFRFELATNTWHRVADMQCPRGLFACGVMDGKIYVAGGICFLPNSHVRDRTLNAEVYYPQSDTWHRLPDTQLQRLRGPDFGLLLDSKFTIISEDSAIAAESYDTRAGTWRAIAGPTLPDQPVKVVSISPPSFPPLCPNPSPPPLSSSPPSAALDSSSFLPSLNSFKFSPPTTLLVLQNLWPVKQYRVSITSQRGGLNWTVGEWTTDRKPGPVAHPREIAVWAPKGKVYLIGNEHSRAIRKRHSYQGPNPLQIAVYDLEGAEQQQQSDKQQQQQPGQPQHQQQQQQWGQGVWGRPHQQAGVAGVAGCATGRRGEKCEGWRKEAERVGHQGSWVMGATVVEL